MILRIAVVCVSMESVPERYGLTPVSNVHTSCSLAYAFGMKGKMRKQIVQIFHNMIGKREAVQPIDMKTAAGAEQQEVPVLQNVFDNMADQKKFTETVDDMIREGRGDGCILVSDLDRFKEVNDIYGHDTGNAVLRNVASILYEHFAECACIGRAGGDIFTLWIPGLSHENAEYVRRQVGRVNDRLLHPGQDLPPVSVSVGAAFYEAGDDCRGLGKKANKMLYRVKENGRCGCEIYRHNGRLA